MDIQELKKYIKMGPFLTDYCGIDAGPGNSHVRHKIRGKDSNNKPLDFTKDEREDIRAGLSLLIADLKREKNKK